MNSARWTLQPTDILFLCFHFQAKHIELKTPQIWWISFSWRYLSTFLWQEVASRQQKTKATESFLIAGSIRKFEGETSLSQCHNSS